MTTIKVSTETPIQVKAIADHTDRSSPRFMLEAIEDEKAWLQSGIDSLKDVEQNGYASTSAELAEKIAQLKKSDWKTAL